MSPSSDLYSVTVSRRAGRFAGQIGHGTVVWLKGEFDVSNTSQLSEVIAETIASDEEDVVVDLSGVTFLSGGTITVLVRANEFLNARSRTLVLQSPTRSATRLLGLFGLTHLISPPPLAVVAPSADAQAVRSWVEVPAQQREAKPDTSARATAPPGSALTCQLRRSW